MVSSSLLKDLPTDTADADTIIALDVNQDGVLGKTELQDVDLSILNNDENFISQLVEDTSPQLAADLDADSNILKNVNQITNLSTPQNPQEAATKDFSGPAETSYTDNTNVEPPYYDTVMVIRIK